MRRRLWPAVYTLLVGGVITAVFVGLVLARGSAGPAQLPAAGVSASPPSFFGPSEDWAVRLEVRVTPPPGVVVGGEPNPLFGVRPFCTDLFELSQTGGGSGQGCDVPRSTFLPAAKFEAFFDNPGGGESVNPSFFDNTLLVASRYSPGSGDVTSLAWPLRIELGTLSNAEVPPGTYTVTISWTDAHIDNIPNPIADPRPVILLEGTPPSSVPAVVDLRSGTAVGGGWSCSRGAGTTSCSVQILAASTVSRFYTIVVGELPAAPVELPPVLLSPASGDLSIDDTPFFEWSPSIGDVIDYLLQVTSADTFNPHLDIEKVVLDPTTSDQTITPLADATYRWRVIARDLDALNAATSDSQTFTVDTTPPTPGPNLINPGIGTRIGDQTPLFVWTPAGGDVVDYRLLVTSGDITTGSVALDVLVTHPTNTFQVPTEDALPDAVYQWQVTARDAVLNTASSPTRTFTVDTTPPSAPVLVAPLDNALLNTGTPLFDWDASTGDIFRYVLQVTSGDIDTGTVVVTQLVQEPATEFQVPIGNTLPDADYQWRVVASDLIGNTSDSETHTFTVDTIPPPAPALIIPRSGDFISEALPFFEWSPSTGADTYLLQVTSADTFNPHLDIELVVPHPGTGHQVETADSLADATYRWRVIASDAAGNTADSEVQTFTVDTVLPPAPVLIQPGSGDLINDDTPLFEWTGDQTDDTFGYLLAVTSGDLNQAFFDLFAAATGDPSLFDPFLIDTGDVPGFDLFQPIAGNPFTGTPPERQFQVPPGDELDDGVYQWRVVATDRAFNTAGSITQTFTLDATPPGTADLVAPINNAFLNDNTPTFDWDASSEATGDVVTYRLQVTSGGAFIQPFAIDAETTGDTTQFTGDALPDDTYQWRVIATDSALNASTSDIRSFSVDTLPPTTADNLLDITVDPEDLTRTFTWNRSVDPIPPGGVSGDQSGVAFYNVVITGPVNVNATADDVCPAGVCQFSTTLPAGRYTISVNAVDRATNESPFTAPVEFAAGPTGVVSGLAVVDPVFGNTVSTPFPEIQWGAPVVLPDPADTVDGGIKTYEVAITGDPVLAPGFNIPFTSFENFAAVCFDGTGDPIGPGGIACTSAIAPDDQILITLGGPALPGGLPDGTHTLGVRIIEEAGRTGDAFPLIFTVDTTPPGQPALVSPANAPVRASFLKDNTPFFQWTLSTGDPFSYRLLVTSGDINTGPVFIDVVVFHPGTGHQAVAPLADGTYEWVVVASDQALNVNTSDTRTFVVDTAAPAPADLALPLQNELLNTRTPFFDWDASPTPADVFDYRLLVVSGDFGTGAVVIDEVGPAAKTNFVTTADLADGGYQWQVIARDRALNTASSVTRGASGWIPVQTSPSWTSP